MNKLLKKSQLFHHNYFLPIKIIAGKLVAIVIILAKASIGGIKFAVLLIGRIKLMVLNLQN